MLYGKREKSDLRTTGSCVTLSAALEAFWCCSQLSSAMAEVCGSGQRDWNEQNGN